MLTNRWCLQCKELKIEEYNEVSNSSDRIPPNLSLIPADPDFGQKLQKFHVATGYFDGNEHCFY
jgi:hypothetical protein